MIVLVKLQEILSLKKKKNPGEAGVNRETCVMSVLGAYLWFFSIEVEFNGTFDLDPERMKAIYLIASKTGFLVVGVT